MPDIPMQHFSGSLRVYLSQFLSPNTSNSDVFILAKSPLREGSCVNHHCTDWELLDKRLN